MLCLSGLELYSRWVPLIAVLLIKILIFFDHSVVFICSKVINAFKR